MAALFPHRYVEALLLGGLLLFSGGCGADEESGSADPDPALRVHALEGEPATFDVATALRGSVVLAGDLPDGATLDAQGSLAWTPAHEQVGEHAIALTVERDGRVMPAILVIEVADAAQPRLTYGGCDCGWSPSPPQPKPRSGELLGPGIIGALFLLRRRGLGKATRAAR